MKKTLLFLSHSSKDVAVTKAFVNFLFKVGLTDKDMFCSSSPELHIPIRQNIYEYLRSLIANNNVYVIYFLSDNYYSSVACLNEMGAAWLKNSEGLSILLPGFCVNDIEGCISKDIISITLGTNDSMTRSQFDDFRADLEKRFNRVKTISNTQWNSALDEFLNTTIEPMREIKMTNPKSYCISSFEHEGCKILKKLSSDRQTVVEIDFSKTEVTLCSIVYFIGSQNWKRHLYNNRHLCFQLSIEGDISVVEVEFHLKGQDRSILLFPLKDDINKYNLLLSEFSDDSFAWSEVREISFLLRRKNVSKGQLTITNLRIE